MAEEDNSLSMLRLRYPQKQRSCHVVIYGTNIDEVKLECNSLEG